MIRNLSYNNKTIKQEVDEAVGKEYGFLEKIKMKGNGSQRLLILVASEKLTNYLKLDNKLDYCNIELRPGGIIIRFRALLETMGWIVPYQQMSLNHNGKELSISDQENFMELITVSNQELKTNFLHKLLTAKNNPDQQFIPA